MRLLIKAVVIDLDAAVHEDAVQETGATIHRIGGRHTEIGVARRRTGHYSQNCHPSAVEIFRKLGGQWPNRGLAVAINRMRCRTQDGETWTTVRVARPRERLGVPAFDPDADRPKTLIIDATTRRLGICLTPSTS